MRLVLFQMTTGLTKSLAGITNCNAEERIHKVEYLASSIVASYPSPLTALIPVIMKMMGMS